jgi:hypothetical protein
MSHATVRALERAVPTALDKHLSGHLQSVLHMLPEELGTVLRSEAR